jgi:hypothetical protein
MAQTTYTQSPAVGKLGLLAYAENTKKSTGYSDAVIPYGRLVVYDAANEKVKLPAAATDILDANSESRPVIGVVIATQDIENQVANTLGVANANVPAYPIGFALPILRDGDIWVWAEEAVVLTDQVFVRHTASGNNKPGNFRQDADTANAALLNGAKFVTETTGAGLVVVRLNLPQAA